MSTIQAPVLLVTYNRPDYTKKVIDAIKDSGIKKLYVFNDGPKPDRSDDKHKCLLIRDMISNLDVEFEIETKYSEVNLGCGLGVSSAISWAFSNEDRLIILEDDCVASPAFIPYCNDLLERYKNDSRVWAVCGENHKFPLMAFQQSDYIFTQFGFCWGWATWRRCWEHFDLQLTSLESVLENKVFENSLSDERIGRQFARYFSRARIDRHKPSFWSLQFWYQVLINRGYYIIPKELLIENIGIDGDHTNNGNEYLNKECSTDYSIVKHPAFVLADKSIENTHYQARVRYLLGDSPLLYKVRNKLHKICVAVFKQPKNYQ